MSCVFQNLAGLQNRYPYNLWQEIIGNCDIQLFLGCTDPLTAEFVSNRTGLASVAVTSQAKKLATFRVTDITPEYRETSGVGKRPVLTPDEVLRLPLEEALIIVRGMKPLKVNKYDYSLHPDYRLLKSCKASRYIPDWRLKENHSRNSPAAPKPLNPKPNEQITPIRNTNVPPTPLKNENKKAPDREVISTGKSSLMVDQ